MPAPQRIALLTFPGIRAFDVSVVTEVWGTDRVRHGVPAFDLRRTAADPAAPIPLRGGLSLTPDRPLDWIDALTPTDLVLVPGIEDPDADVPAPALDALRRAHTAGVPVASLCAGAFVLARAGLLDGRRAVTHWRLADTLAARHPKVRVEPEALYIEDTGIWTSAGTAAGIDLCLHLVRTAHGAEAAATVARSMVTAPFRTGTQAQFIERPTPRTDRDADALAAVRAHALAHLDQPHTVASLAAHAGMSPRSFARHFQATTGTTPLHWLITQRVAAAQKLLERTDHPLPEVARRAGFGSEVTMRQHFASHLATSPRDYRGAFRQTAGSSPIAR
ncbi:helix-turn-helix domain-containing protein [Streptomyces sp. R302]|uniref:GlxA family transcriptional regulator n=1 Tax=unclassified Streptomyces TaxID=2593676 RepID=UPI00145C6C9F|nr:MULTISPECIES: helix-turn-helix domain-containing protein [unclassified Streptomyces]NML52047.1 helix-turn-helix domain-containing protein [Streptomyces sp. R301]NML82487.1 helix-turn-helix domain-containing protein [Streptomyces sp. R302]